MSRGDDESVSRQAVYVGEADRWMDRETDGQIKTDR